MEYPTWQNGKIATLHHQRMRLNCCNENLNKLITNKCSAEEKMKYKPYSEAPEAITCSGCNRRRMVFVC